MGKNIRGRQTVYLHVRRRLWIQINQSLTMLRKDNLGLPQPSHGRASAWTQPSGKCNDGLTMDRYPRCCSVPSQLVARVSSIKLVDFSLSTTAGLRQVTGSERRRQPVILSSMGRWVAIRMWCKLDRTANEAGRGSMGE